NVFLGKSVIWETFDRKINSIEVENIQHKSDKEMEMEMEKEKEKEKDLGYIYICMRSNQTGKTVTHLI
ncbi:MAG: hypothetical protein N7Q72_07490, partial [Spiroplasma sp. Tabriz.8]|nr:hypothetical protein [Spiroplasma sp. Tabriz.8]